MTTPITSEVPYDIIEDAYKVGWHQNKEGEIVVDCDWQDEWDITKELVEFAQLQRLREHSSKEVVEVEPIADAMLKRMGEEVLKRSDGLGWTFEEVIELVRNEFPPPSSHQAALSMKQKCLDIVNKYVDVFSPNTASKTILSVKNNLMAVKVEIEAIPTVEESK